MGPLPGTIGLARIKGFVGWLVWLMQAINGDFSKWTHVFVVLDDGTVFEAQPGGAVISPLEKYLDGRPVAFVPWDMPDSARETIVRLARSHDGVGYNWTTYFYLAAYRLRLPKLTAMLKYRVSRSKKLICSQAADYFYLKAGQHLFDDGRLPYDVTPGDVARLLPRH
jgi:hypothetical protein